MLLYENQSTAIVTTYESPVGDGTNVVVPGERECKKNI